MDLERDPRRDSDAERRTRSALESECFPRGKVAGTAGHDSHYRARNAVSIIGTLRRRGGVELGRSHVERYRLATAIRRSPMDTVGVGLVRDTVDPQRRRLNWVSAAGIEVDVGGLV
jgi:hypothetical protein